MIPPASIYKTVRVVLIKGNILVSDDVCGFSVLLFFPVICYVYIFRDKSYWFGRDLIEVSY